MILTQKLSFFRIGILIAIVALATYGQLPAAASNSNAALLQVETGSVTSQVSASADDAEEPSRGGLTDLNSSDLELGTDVNSQWVGMRFNNITVPLGATILSAYVEFEVDETGSDSTSVTIQGQAIDNAPAFANVNNDLTSRARTVAQISWNDIPPWTVTSAKWQTPDLSPIIQETVNRPGWASGNSIAILISGSGRRTAEAYDGEIPAAPKLVIQYAIGDTPTPDPNATATFTPTASSTSTASSTPTATATASPSPTATRSQTPGPSPTSAPGGNIRFAIIGDFGDAGTAERDVANRVKSWNPEFVITTGDNTYSSSIDQNIGQYYHEFIYPYTGSYGAGATTNRFFPSIGNHDWDESNGQIYFNYFVLPGNERYYDFVRGPVHFFVIDSDTREPDGTSSSSSQALWLQSALASSSSPWNVVYFHHPPYSSSSASSYMRWPFQAWGADIVIAGHRHNYERIMLSGFPYIVNGLGGSTSIHSFGSPVTGSVVRYNNDFGAMLTNASSSQMSFQFITRTGAVIDSFSLGTTVPGSPTWTPTATATRTPTRTPTAGPSPTPTMTVTRTPTPAPGTQIVITSQVVSSSDDAEEAVSSGSMSLTSSDLELGADGSVTQLVGMRFNNISIPRNAIILNAYVEFEVDETGSTATSVTIQGQATDNAATFTTTARNITNRARTTAQVAWNNIPAWTVLDAKWQTPNLSSIIQEIVNRPAWASGNSMVIIISGTGRRTAEAYNGEIPAAAKLVITYRVP